MLNTRQLLKGIQFLSNISSRSSCNPISSLYIFTSGSRAGVLSIGELRRGPLKARNCCKKKRKLV
jgi:hypothetical protein